jgi:hypothetical protein
MILFREHHIPVTPHQEAVTVEVMKFVTVSVTVPVTGLEGPKFWGNGRLSSYHRNTGRIGIGV